MRKVQERRSGPPRVAYILKRFPRLSETFIAREILALERMGFEIAIFSMKVPLGQTHPFIREIESPVIYLPRVSGRNLIGLLRANGESFLRRPAGYLRCLFYALRRRSTESMEKFLLAGYISRYILDRRVEHLHSHFASGSTRLAKYVHMITGLPYSFTAHAKDIFSDRVSVKQLERRMTEARFVVTISAYNERFLRGITPDVMIHVIHNGIPIEQFPLNNGQAKREEKPIILSVGRLVEKKGMSCLIDACDELKKRGVAYRCLIVGDGPLRGELEARIERLGLEDHVSLEGAKLQDELIGGYFPRASIFALPCQQAKNKDMDGLPVVLEEAMAVGLPVISTTVAGIPELVRHRQTGLLVPPEDPGRLAETIQSLLADGSLREGLKSSARRLIENEYDIEKSSRRLAELFMESIDGR